MIIRIGAALALAACASASFAAPPSADYVIQTFRNGQLVGERPATRGEFHAAAAYLVDFSRDKTVSHVQQIDMARALTAKQRCFNLYAVKMAKGGVELGKIDSNANSDDFLTDSIAALEDVNKKAGVSCSIRVTGR